MSEPSNAEKYWHYCGGWLDAAGGRASDPSRVLLGKAIPSHLARFYEAGYEDGFVARVKALEAAADRFDYKFQPETGRLSSKG